MNGVFKDVNVNRYCANVIAGYAEKINKVDSKIGLFKRSLLTLIPLTKMYVLVSMPRSLQMLCIITGRREMQRTIIWQ